MKMLNTQIAEKFNEIADLLEIMGENRFRIRAYRNAAILLENLPHEAADIITANKSLTDLPGIGKDLAEKITTLVNTGELPLLTELEKKVPATLSQMMKIPDLGPHRVKTLYEELNIKNFSDLKKAIIAKKISKLPGFGEKIEARIASTLHRYINAEKRIKFTEAEIIVKSLVSYIEKIRGVEKIAIAGSYRRCKETIGDIDILVTAKKNAKVMEHFIAYDNVANVISHGEARATVKLNNDIQVDLRLVEPNCFGSALQYFTGSKDHNVVLRTMAIKKKLKLNEYGVFKGEKLITGKTEKEVYTALGLPYIEPEMRENRGEIELAQKNKLPKLITIDDIRGDLHCHTDATDGVNTLEEMVDAAKQHGYEYLAISDHSKRLTFIGGLTPERILKQIEQIDKLNAKLKNFRILKSSEVDILEDGSLDFPDEVLRELDFTVCSIHYKFNLSREKQTERVLKAMDNPYFNIFAHPTGRLINEREPYEIDLEKIMLKAKKCGCIMELNSQPDRLDLNDINCKMAKEMGVKISIATDSHNSSSLAYIKYGINQARRGWLEPKDVINTLKLKDLINFFKRQ